MLIAKNTTEYQDDKWTTKPREGTTRQQPKYHQTAFVQTN